MQFGFQISLSWLLASSLTPRMTYFPGQKFSPLTRGYAEKYLAGGITRTQYFDLKFGMDAHVGQCDGKN